MRAGGSILVFRYAGMRLHFQFSVCGRVTAFPSLACGRASALPFFDERARGCVSVFGMRACGCTSVFRRASVWLHFRFWSRARVVEFPFFLHVVSDFGSVI